MSKYGQKQAICPIFYKKWTYSYIMFIFSLNLYLTTFSCIKTIHEKTLHIIVLYSVGYKVLNHSKHLNLLQKSSKKRR